MIMKNPILYVLVIFSLVAISCDKDDAKADVEKLITNLEYFNETFDEFYEDGEISTEAEGNQDSEYDQLRTIANSYYETVHKINKRIEEEKQEKAEGKKIDNYEENYNEAVKEKSDKLEQVSQEFIENLEKIEEYK
jgi:methyl-accepting chemotaxis protein